MKPRLGWSLVELLVVIAIIGILISLLLPAIQAVREGARRARCSHNLRQIGIAIHHYELVHRELPPGCYQWRPFGGNVNLKNIAWSAYILPFMEQENLHRLVDFSVPFDHPNNVPAAKTNLPIYLCPSSQLPNPDQLGRSDYGGLYGQRITIRSPTDNGVFIHDQAIRLQEIHDGLTHTMAVAEDARSPNAFWIDGGNVFEQAGGINDPTVWVWDNEIRSEHPGGANALFCCGRVQFLSNSTELLALAALITRDFGD